jgi:hypothetical protein
VSIDKYGEALLARERASRPMKQDTHHKPSSAVRGDAPWPDTIPTGFANGRSSDASPEGEHELPFSLSAEPLRVEEDHHADRAAHRSCQPTALGCRQSAVSSELRELRRRDRIIFHSAARRIAFLPHLYATASRPSSNSMPATNCGEPNVEGDKGMM